MLVPGSRFELPCGARLGCRAQTDVLAKGLDLLGEALAEFDPWRRPVRRRIASPYPAWGFGPGRAWQTASQGPFA